MKIENHLKPLPGRMADGPLEGVPPGGPEGPVSTRIHVAEGMKVDAHGLEPGLPDEAKMLLLKAPLLSVPPDGVVTQDVHAPSKTLVLRECIRRLRRTRDGCREC